MGQKEVEMIRSMNLPQDSKFIRAGRGVIIGIQTSDQSFDYTTEGQNFLGGRKKLDAVK